MTILGVDSAVVNLRSFRGFQNGILILLTDFVNFGIVLIELKEVFL